MTKVTICDLCKSRHDKITQTNKYLRVKGHRDLRFDLCAVHMHEVTSKFPKATPEFVQFVYEITRSVEITLETAQELARRR